MTARNAAPAGGESPVDYQRRCSFDKVALDVARVLADVFATDHPPWKQITMAQIAITDLLMTETADRDRLHAERDEARAALARARDEAQQTFDRLREVGRFDAGGRNFYINTADWEHASSRDRAARPALADRPTAGRTEDDEAGRRAIADADRDGGGRDDAV